jgi:hypothetical protein
MTALGSQVRVLVGPPKRAIEKPYSPTLSETYPEQPAWPANLEIAAAAVPVKNGRRDVFTCSERPGFAGPGTRDPGETDS